MTYIFDPPGFPLYLVIGIVVFAGAAVLLKKGKVGMKIAGLVGVLVIGGMGLAALGLVICAGVGYLALVVTVSYPAEGIIVVAIVLILDGALFPLLRRAATTAYACDYTYRLAGG